MFRFMQEPSSGSSPVLSTGLLPDDGSCVNQIILNCFNISMIL